MTANSVAALAIAELTVTTAKQTATEEGGTNDDELKEDNDSSWGRNHGNPAHAGHQERMPKKQKNSPNGHYTLSAFCTT